MQFFCFFVVFVSFAQLQFCLCWNREDSAVSILGENFIWGKMQCNLKCTMLYRLHCNVVSTVRLEILYA